MTIKYARIKAMVQSTFSLSSTIRLTYTGLKKNGYKDILPQTISYNSCWNQPSFDENLPAWLASIQ